MLKHEIEISADESYQTSEIAELADAFASVFQVHTKKYQRFGAREYVPILIIVFGLITQGFFQAIGKDIWENLKKKVGQTVSNRKGVSEVEFHYAYNGKDVELKVISENQDVVESAFDQIQHTLDIVEKGPQGSIYLEFDSDTNGWVSKNQLGSTDRKVVYKFEGTMATTDPVVVGGQRFQFSEETLKQAAREVSGMPMKYEHTGPPIGRVETAWYENGRLKVRGVIFEPTDDREREILDAVKKGKLKGLSLAFSYESKRPRSAAS